MKNTENLSKMGPRKSQKPCQSSRQASGLANDANLVALRKNSVQHLRATFTAIIDKYTNMSKNRTAASVEVIYTRDLGTPNKVHEVDDEEKFMRVEFDAVGDPACPVDSLVRDDIFGDDCCSYAGAMEKKLRHQGLAADQRREHLAITANESTESLASERRLDDLGYLSIRMAPVMYKFLTSCWTAFFKSRINQCVQSRHVPRSAAVDPWAVTFDKSDLQNVDECGVVSVYKQFGNMLEMSSTLGDLSGCGVNLSSNPEWALCNYDPSTHNHRLSYAPFPQNCPWDQFYELVDGNGYDDPDDSDEANI